MLDVPVWIAVVLWVLALGGWLVAWRMRRAARRTVAGLIADLDHARADVPDLHREVEIARGRASEYQAVIGGAIEETKTWQRLYYGNAIEHGNAQALLLRYGETVVHAMEGLRQRVIEAKSIEEAHGRAHAARLPNNATVDKVVAQFRDTHVQQALAARAADQSRPPGPA